MEPTSVKRKLAVILAADAEGYTRLMHEAEEPTLETLTDYRQIIDGLIARHEGRVFGTDGDSVMAEFGSAVGRYFIGDSGIGHRFRSLAVEPKFELAALLSGISAVDQQVGAGHERGIVGDEK